MSIVQGELERPNIARHHRRLTIIGQPQLPALITLSICLFRVDSADIEGANGQALRRPGVRGTRTVGPAQRALAQVEEETRLQAVPVSQLLVRLQQAWQSEAASQVRVQPKAQVFVSLLRESQQKNLRGVRPREMQAQGSNRGLRRSRGREQNTHSEDAVVRLLGA